MRDKGLIYDIKKFSIHDGPGIRTTVFLKGCPLNCIWCHNPESIDERKEFLHNKDNCVLCGECVTTCPESALLIEDGKLKWNREKCTFCGECEIACVYRAREIVGKEYSIEEILTKIDKDKIIYEESGGGVTVSGGEPLNQIDFVEKLLSRLKEKNIHTAVDTSGHTSWRNLEKIAEIVDLFLYDFKIFDEEKHRKFIGKSNKLILENLKKLDKIHDNINIRIPLILGTKESINTDDENIKSTIKFLKETNIKKISLLPYHNGALHKYKKLGKTYNNSEMKGPNKELIELIKNKLENNGFILKIGG